MIVIYGATGMAGEMISRELSARGANIAIAGRDRRRLDELAAQLSTRVAVRVAGVHEPARLRAAFDGADVVIGCAGPFARLGRPILETAIECGAHYIDIGNDQPFLRETYESFEAAAHRAGVVCVSGLAFRIALGDWAAALAYSQLGSPEELDELSVAYALRKPQLTARERASAAVALSSPTLVWNRDRWQTVAPGSERRMFSFGSGFGENEAVLFGGGEVITVPRHIEARSVRTFLWIETQTPLLWEATRLAPFLSPVLGPLVAGPLARFVRAQAEATAPRQRTDDGADTEFSVVATATSGFETSRIAVRGRDPYRLSAEICSAGALALAKRPHSEGGVLTPAQVFDPRARLYSLASRELIEVDE